MNRRQFAMQTGAILFTPILLESRGQAGRESQNESARSYSEELPDMLVSYLAKRLNDLAGTWDQKRALIATGADVQARNAFVRTKFLEMLRRFPRRQCRPQGRPTQPRSLRFQTTAGNRCGQILSLYELAHLG